MESILSIGLQGVQTGVNNARNAAQDIVATTTQTTELAPGAGDTDTTISRDVTGDLATSFVELKVSENQVKASAAVIRTADEIMGTLIDIKA